MSKGEVGFWIFFTFMCGVFALGLVGAYHVDKDRIAFIDACETMGGVAIVGNYGTRACFKSEVLK